MKLLVWISILINISTLLFVETFTVGIYDNPPLCYLENNFPKGIYVDLLSEIAKQENWKIQYKYGIWDEYLGRITRRFERGKN